LYHFQQLRSSSPKLRLNSPQLPQLPDQGMGLNIKNREAERLACEIAHHQFESKIEAFAKRTRKGDEDP
jgi:hypothetical protein